MNIPKSDRLLIEGNEKLRQNQKEQYDLEIKKLNYKMEEQEEELVGFRNRNNELDEFTRKLIKYISKIDEVRKAGGVLIEKVDCGGYANYPPTVVIPEIRFLAGHFLEKNIERWKVTVKDKIQNYDLNKIKEEFHWVKLVDDDNVKEELKDKINELLDLLIELRDEE